MITVIKAPVEAISKADGISYTPSNGMTSTDVQSAIDELEEKVLNIDGGTAANPVV